MSSATGFSPSVFGWITFFHNYGHESIDQNDLLQTWVPHAVNDENCDWSLLKTISSVNIPNISNVIMKLIFKILIKMTVLTSLNLSGKHHG